MILKKLYHGNLKVSQPKNLLLVLLLMIVFFPSIKCYEDSNFCLSFKGSCLKQKNSTFTPPNRMTFFIVYKLDTWSRHLNFDFTLKDCLFGGIKLAKNAEPYRYVHRGYDIGFDLRSKFLLPDGSVGKNVIIFGADMRSLVHIANKKKDNLILRKSPTQGLEENTLKV